MIRVDPNQIISVVTPSYNQGQFISDTIESICGQEGNFYIDYVIVDGLSKDNSFDLIKKFHTQYTQGTEIAIFNQLRFFKNDKVNCLGLSFRYLHEKDTGHGNAINKGFRLTVGNNMAWLNSDDKYHPGAFQTVIDIFQNFAEVEWLTGKPTLFNKEGQCTWEDYDFKNIFDFLILDYKWIQQESTFWKRNLWQKAGSLLDESIKYMVDGDLWGRFFLLAEHYHVDATLGGYRLHDTNRAILNAEAIEKEMTEVVTRLRGKAEPSIDNLAKKLLLPKYDLAFHADATQISYKMLIKSHDLWNIEDIHYLTYKLAKALDSIPANPPTNVPANTEVLTDFESVLIGAIRQVKSKLIPDDSHRRRVLNYLKNLFFDMRKRKR